MLAVTWQRLSVRAHFDPSVWPSQDLERLDVRAPRGRAAYSMSPAIVPQNALLS